MSVFGFSLLFMLAGFAVLIWVLKRNNITVEHKEQNIEHAGKAWNKQGTF